MKCRAESDILLSSITSFRVGGLCDHKICQSCFRKEDKDLASRPPNIYTCPCCHGLFYDNIQSIDDAILIGEAATLFNYISPQLFSVRGTVMAGDLIRIHEMNKLVIEKLELGLQSNPTNFDIMHSLNVSCSDGAFCLESHDEINFQSKFYRLRLFDYSLRILDHPAISVGPETVKTDCYHHLAEIFSEYHNYSASFKYAKLAYEHCVRSTEHRDLSSHSRALYLKSRADFAKLSKLRFAVGDEVEFLHELETGNEWRLGKVLELYYWEPGFDKNFSAPYRIQLLDVSADQPPVCLGQSRPRSLCPQGRCPVDRGDSLSGQIGRQDRRVC